MNDADVILERDTANDETASIVAIHVASGSAVEKDDLIFDIENSKATQELRAPRAGILSHNLQIGHTVAFGVPIARVLSPDEWAGLPSHAAITVAEEPSPPKAIAPGVVADTPPAEATDVVLERETANDETGSVVAVHVASGVPVDEGQLIIKIETSKATQELTAPRAGLLIHDLSVGQTVAFGVPIARIVPAGPSIAVLAPAGPSVVITSDAMASQPSAPGPFERGPSVPHAEEPPQAASRSTMVSASFDSATPRPLSTGFTNELRSPEPQAGSAQEEERRVQTDRKTAVPPAAPHHPAPPRFSKAAAALMAELSGSPSAFTTGFVTADDVRSLFGKAPPRSTVETIEPVRIKAQGEAVGRRKRAEIETLRLGAGDTLLSVLGITIGPLAIPRTSDAFLTARITDLVIYEAARLMRKYPKLNAFYDDHSVVEHAAVHAGLALDDGGRLMVYGIEHADRASLRDISATIGDVVARYVANELTAKELSRATFTVSDLSAAELDFILPLLPRGQSCILGITRSRDSGFRIFAGFDHRVTEGREVSLFLGELKDRLLSFASGPATTSAQLHCLYCDKSATEAVSKSKDRGLMKIVDRQGREALCCASCWNGW